MKRIIVDYAKLTNEILTLLVEKFPDGYDDADVIQFTNAKGELIEAVEVRTEDTIYLVKVSTKLQDRIENFDEDDVDGISPVDSINVKDLDIEDEEEDEKPKRTSKKKAKKTEDEEEDGDEDFDDEDEDDFDEDDDFEDDEDDDDFDEDDK